MGEVCLDEGQFPPVMMSRLLDSATDCEPRLRQLLVQHLAEKLRGRHLNDLRDRQFHQLMQVLKSNKAYVQALFEPGCKEQVWCPSFTPAFTQRNKKGEVRDQQRPGFSLQENSLLGW